MNLRIQRLFTVVAIALTTIPWIGKAALAQEREINTPYPEQVAALKAECPAPNEFVVYPYDADRVGFLCWGAPAADNSRTGQWLGVLPLSEDPNFGEPFTCSLGDTTCEALLPQLQANYANELKAAEFACAVKRGSLFLQLQAQTVDMRCGFFAATVSDEDGNGTVDYEDEVSVDISMFVAEITPGTSPQGVSETSCWAKN